MMGFLLSIDAGVETHWLRKWLLMLQVVELERIQHTSTEAQINSYELQIPDMELQHLLFVLLGF